MKSRKTDIRVYEKQFYKGNVVLFIYELCAIFISAVGALMVSWLIQQLIDLIAGLLECFSKPRFISRGIAQYKEYIFGELTKKNIAAFSNENSSTYISSLTNDIPAIEKGYL